MLNDKDHAEKYLRALHRELDRLETRRRHPPTHELIPPIQRGWKRYFVPTPAAHRRPDAATLAAILDHLNTVQYFWRPDFHRTRRQSKARRGLVPIEQELMAISRYAWEREPVPPSWQKYFRSEFLPVERLLACRYGRARSEQHYPANMGFSGRREWGYEFRFASYCELKVEKHWLTHYAEIEPGVAGRTAEIERWMDFHRGRQRFGRLKGRSQSWRHRNASAYGRRERQIQREMRAHLGFLVVEAAEYIPSMTPRWGARRVGCPQPSCLRWIPLSIFAAVRLEILRSPQHRDRQVSQAPALRARAVGPDTARANRFRFPRHISVRTGCVSASRRGRLTVRVQANGPECFSDRLSPQNTPGCARHSGPVNFRFGRFSRQ